MHLIIVEDFVHDRDRLEALLRDGCAAQGQPVQISSCASGEDFLSVYRPGSCDGVFLDILLDGMTGIELAKTIRKQEPRLPIIFTTTEPDFALDGFSVHATDYLLKPVSADKVSWCLKELREYLAAPDSISLSAIIGRGHSHPINIPLDDILYAQYWKHCMEVYTISGLYSARISFQDFIALLPSAGRFYVCGRGLVVNLSQIVRVGDGELLLKNGETLPFSRSRKPEVQKAFAEWAFDRSRKGGWA